MYCTLASAAITGNPAALKGMHRSITRQTMNEFHDQVVNSVPTGHKVIQEEIYLHQARHKKVKYSVLGDFYLRCGDFNNAYAAYDTMFGSETLTRVKTMAKLLGTWKILYLSKRKLYQTVVERFEDTADAKLRAVVQGLKAYESGNIILQLAEENNRPDMDPPVLLHIILNAKSDKAFLARMREMEEALDKNYDQVANILVRCIVNGIEGESGFTVEELMNESVGGHFVRMEKLKRDMQTFDATMEMNLKKLPSVPPMIWPGLLDEAPAFSLMSLVPRSLILTREPEIPANAEVAVLMAMDLVEEADYKQLLEFKKKFKQQVALTCEEKEKEISLLGTFQQGLMEQLKNLL